MLAFALACWGAVAEFQEAGSFNATVAFSFSWAAFFFATTVGAWSDYHHLDYLLQAADRSRTSDNVLRPADVDDLVALAFIVATVCMGGAARLVGDDKGITWFDGGAGAVGRRAAAHVLDNDIVNPAYTAAAAAVHAGPGPAVAQANPGFGLEQAASQAASQAPF